MGYKPKVTKASSTMLEVFQLIPAKGTAPYAPDYDYALTIGENAVFGSSNVLIWSSKTVSWAK